VIPKPINEIFLPDLQALIGNVREGRTIEYKSDMPGRAASDVVPFLAEVSSLANTSGGDFILGIEETEGLATAVPGLTLGNVDMEKLRLEQLLANGLEPRLPRPDVYPVDCGNSRYALIIRTTKSWLAPHRVKANDKFYGRNSAGKYPLDVSELRTAFALSASFAERARSFHAERIIKVAGRELPLRLVPNAPVILLHVIPYSAFDLGRSLSLVEVEEQWQHFPPVGRSRPQNWAINFDGFLGLPNTEVTDHEGNPAEQHAYVQVFQSGIVEGVGEAPHGADEVIKTNELESYIVSYSWKYATSLSMLGVEPPFLVLVSLLGVGNNTFLCGHEFDFRRAVPARADRDNYYLIESILNITPPDRSECAKALRLTLDHLANLAGMPRAPTFDDAGNYLQKSRGV
jgi:hypothetical protein